MSIDFDFSPAQQPSISLADLIYNVVISGKKGSGKTTLLAHISNQIYDKVHFIGVLNIRLRKSQENELFRFDKVLHYGDPDLIIPYFIEAVPISPIREQFSYFLNAIFGFHPEVRTNSANIINTYEKGMLPNSLVDFLKVLKAYLRSHPYAEDFTRSNVISVKNAMNLFYREPLLERSLRNISSLPDWLVRWGKGEKICIDLSCCNLKIQKILVAAIFQAVKNYIPQNESQLPSGIIMVDDCDRIFKSSPWDEYKRNFDFNKDYYYELEEENYFLTKEQMIEVYEDPDYLFNVQMEGMYHTLIRDELRYRNLCLITVCEDISEVYKSIPKNSQIKFFF